MGQPLPMRALLAWTLAFALLHVALAGRAGASGFEKTVAWSGRYAGLADAASADVSGPEAVYFNPAGLAGAPRGAISLNFSPSFARPTGGFPVPSLAQQLGGPGDRRTIPLAGVLASCPLSRRWGVGIGYYAAAGIQAFYEEIDYRPVIPTATLRPTIKADLELTELALGAAYQVAPGLRVGGAWRVVKAEGEFSSVRILSPTAFQNVLFRDLTDTAYGLRLGVQYRAPDQKWGMGAVWRSQVDFTGRGGVSALADVGGTVTPIPGGPASIANALPQQATLGGFLRLSPSLRLLGEYAWTEYSVDRALDVSGSLGGVSLDTIADVPQQWKNQHAIRVGVECLGVGRWAIRGGYAYASRVTSPERARATFTPPAAAHTFALGAGRRLSSHATLDLAVDYSFSYGTGSNTDPNPLLSENIAPGTFRADALTLHSGLTYEF